MDIPYSPQIAGQKADAPQGKKAGQKARFQQHGNAVLFSVFAHAAFLLLPILAIFIKTPL